MAARWSGTAASWVNLHPAAYVGSECAGTDGIQDVGWVQDVNGDFFAGYWNAGGGWIDLNPLGAPFSRAYGVSGGQQVGWYATLPWYDLHAALWTGTPGSVVDLNPAGSTFAVAWKVAAGQQVGYAMIAGVQRASKWTGSAASWVDLTPAVAGGGFVNGTNGVQQVGAVNIGGANHAALWSGTAASFVDLNPPGVSGASANAVDAGEQVGSGNFPTLQEHAYFWAGSAATWVDLHTALPSYYQNSRATAIWHAGGRAFVLGTARNQNTQLEECILWQKLPTTTYCTAKINSLGCTPSIGSYGSWTATGTTFQFTVFANQLRNNSNGLLLYSLAGRAALPFHGGLMCTAAPRVRGPAMNSSGWGPPVVDCSGFFLVDMNSLRAGSLGAAPAPFLSIPGTTVDAQFWARDAGFSAPNNVQLTNAIEFEVGP